MKNIHDINNLTHDYQTLTPAQWEVLKDEIIRRAHQERAKALHALFRTLFSSLGRAIAGVWTAVSASRHPEPPRTKCDYAAPRNSRMAAVKRAG